MKETIMKKWLMLKEWWMNLAPREKQAVAIGGFLLGIFIIYQGIWSPLMNAVADERERIGSDQKTLIWMQSADKAIQKIENNSHNKNKILTPVDLLSILQAQIEHAGLAQYLTQLKQATNDTVEMHFQKVEFDKLIKLLTSISKEQHVSILQMGVIAENAPGIVNMDVVLSVNTK